MPDNKDTEAFYKRLKEELLNTSLWPSAYLYKFIVPTADDKIHQIEEMFNNMGAVIDTKTSSNGKYTSLSIHVKMEDPDAVIAKYKEVSTVEGVISL
ncbi:DUF493 family protein [Zhouia sp. PK063]|uniref:DUF493 family protein n=1 Tax=Zhouia sp. PK063 TaxID=3373602 RepID=UPI00379B7B22